MTKDVLKARIEKDYHYPRNQAKADRFETVRLKAKELALVVVDILPIGRELDAALLKIEEACMHASAGIARAEVWQLGKIGTTSTMWAVCSTCLTEFITANEDAIVECPKGHSMAVMAEGKRES